MPDDLTATQQDTTAIVMATIRMPEHLWSSIRKAAIDERTTAAQLCIDALTQFMERRNSNA